jgi:polyphosphate:AMP phosphotransferase
MVPEMLEKTDLTKTADMEKYEKTLAPLRERLAVLQRTLREQGIPTIILIEGWDAAGITMSTHAIIQALDPRGFTLHAISRPTDEERARPFLWRFWTRTPPNGRIALFARGWYSRAISAEMQKNAWIKSMEGKIHAINNFERTLTDNGALIIKFFLHIDKVEQKRRLEERERNPLTAWLVTPAIWNLHRHYDTSLPVVDDLLEKTDTDYAPWSIIEATDRNYTILKVYSILVKTLEKRVEETGGGKIKKSRQKEIVLPKKNIVKRRSTPDSTFTKEECQETLSTLQIEMLELHYLLFKRQIPLIIMYEGWDAAGKGGNITRIARYMNPLGYDVIPIAAPDQSEKDHHYLWRFIRHYPRAGHIAIYDRSWYGRVLVERVENFCTDTEWQRAYQEINEMEEDYILSSGGGIVKFWLEISKEEQLKRFQQRAADPHKTYKITDDDWRNREKWDLYDTAIDEMLARTSTPLVPWTVIESDNKWYARVKALRTVIETVRTLL